MYVGTDKEYVDHVHELVVKELNTVREEVIPEKELVEAKSQLKGKLLLSQENTSNRMTRLAKSELHFGRFVSLDELVEHIDAVQANDIQAFAADFFDPSTYSEGILHPKN